MSEVHIAYVALGANIAGPAGTPRQTLEAALGRLADLGSVTPSSLYQTEPVGYADQPAFLNGVAAIKTTLGPEELLDNLLTIEREFGRDRSHGILNGPRSLDLDLLLYDQSIMKSDRLELPHPRMTERAFVLVPLVEVAPELSHPIQHKSMQQLLDDLTP